jgi:hypothetical protein
MNMAVSLEARYQATEDEARVVLDEILAFETEHAKVCPGESRSVIPFSVSVGPDGRIDIEDDEPDDIASVLQRTDDDLREKRDRELHTLIENAEHRYGLLTLRLKFLTALVTRS